MLSNKPSLGNITVSSSPSFFIVLKFNLAAIALGLLMCFSAYGMNSLSGEVYYENAPYQPPGSYIRDAYVCAYGSPTVCAYTSPGGIYFLLNLGSGPYDVCVTKTAGADVNGAITHADALAVAAHVAGTTPLPTDDLKWAADASCNLLINSTDAARIDNWAGSHNSYGCTGEWRFLPEGASVPWPTNDGVTAPGPTPATTPNPYVCKHYSSISGEVNDENFEAILKGEVTGDWVCPNC